MGFNSKLPRYFAAFFVISQAPLSSVKLSKFNRLINLNGQILVIGSVTCNNLYYPNDPNISIVYVNTLILTTDLSPK